MIDPDALGKQIRANCDISDAQHAGIYSMCTLALRLRDLYKWENGLHPWEEGEPASVLDWIGEKEQVWEDLKDASYADLIIGSHRFDPFETVAINAVLEPAGLFYGAGYAHSLKPSFFLGVIVEKRVINGCAVTTIGRELARDLLTIPAFTQDRQVLLRGEAARLYLWDKLQYVNKSGRSALRFALNSCGIKNHHPDALKGQLGTVFGVQKATYIYHELGEIQDTVFHEDTWRRIISDFPHTPIELAARAVKDLLADTNPHGTLPHMINRRQSAALGLYVAFSDGLVKILFPELPAAFKKFAATGNWPVIDDAIATGYRTAKHYAGLLTDIYNQGQNGKDRQWVESEMADRVLSKLGIV